METLVRDSQEQYYQALRATDSSADAAPFIEFMPETILRALQGIDQVTAQDNVQVSVQVRLVMDKLGNEAVSANELMRRVGLRHLATFRKNYLKPALDLGLVEMTVPDKPNSRNQKYKRTPPAG